MHTAPPSCRAPCAHLVRLKGEAADVQEAAAQQLIRAPHVPSPHLNRQEPAAGTQLAPLEHKLLAPVGIQRPARGARVCKGRRW